MQKHLLLVADIFGHNADLEALAAGLAPHAASIRIVTPYDGMDLQFATSGEAYGAFLERCGHDAYLAKVRSALQGQEKPVLLVGFSAGASAAWRALDSDVSDTVSQCIGFYPTRIRHHLNISLHVPTTLVLPAIEPLFSVDELIADLASFPLVSCLRTEYLHGFMNPVSSGYHPEARENFTAYLRSLLLKR